MKASYKKHILQFIVPGGTSRGILKEKDSWIIRIEENGVAGYGEAGIIPGLSIDTISQIETVLKNVCIDLENGKNDFSELITDFPAIHFAIETALMDLDTGGTGKMFETDFTNEKSGILMNGLVWMNQVNVMKEEGIKKISEGFKCIKFKIGSFDFEEEFNMLKHFRNKYGSDLEIRVDANGAYDEKNVFSVMEKLASLKIHSIEQPVKPKKYLLMAEICRECETPVAIDEELIGVKKEEIDFLLTEIFPAYIILKPSLLGGWKIADEWIKNAEKNNIGWWATSALESNIGLNAIAQWVSQYDLKMPQGLGTGSLYLNNFKYGLEVRNDSLWYHPAIKREISF